MARSPGPIHHQHFAGDRASNREILGFCAQEVDKALSVLVQRVKKKVLVTIDKIDTQLLRLEGNMRWVLIWFDVY